MTVDQESAAEEKRWLQALEALGPRVVAAKLEGPGTNYGRGADVLGIVDGGPHPSRAFIESWLAVKNQEIQARETARFRWVLWMAVIAAIFSAIAAWPVIKPWLD